MANSSSRIRMPDSLRVNQPTLSKKTWMGSLQQRTLELAFPEERVGGQHCWPSTHWSSPQLRRAWQAEIRHADKKVPVVLPPPSRRGFMSGSQPPPPPTPHPNLPPGCGAARCAPLRCAVPCARVFVRPGVKKRCLSLQPCPDRVPSRGLRGADRDGRCSPSGGRIRLLDRGRWEWSRNDPIIQEHLYEAYHIFDKGRAEGGMLPSTHPCAVTYCAAQLRRPTALRKTAQ
ncbi:unnamed protein product [Menidia menidia]|uniref:(Atlantic silverside) hypothetical protein n=1 Tax=Menidia menidia TaxID=238744 RepID=A0A8S4BMT8_9TELE|nr:unnamed protein product [Menidia menidia]